jgi:acyl carrier protein
MKHDATTTQDTSSVIEDFIRRRFRVRDDDSTFGTDVNLWEAGYVDSAGAVEMIAFLEETFDVTLPEGVLFDPDFGKISGMVRVLDKARASGADSG